MFSLISIGVSLSLIPLMSIVGIPIIGIPIYPIALVISILWFHISVIFGIAPTISPLVLPMLFISIPTILIEIEVFLSANIECMSCTSY